MSEERHTDHALIQKVLDGNSSEFTLIVGKYKNNVASICMNMLKDPNLADEVGQDVFVRLYRALPNYRGEASLKTYISRIAMNLCLNKIKQQQTWWNRFKQDTPEVYANYAVSSESNKYEDKELIRMGLSGMDERSRSLIVLRMIEGYSIRETAEILEIKEGTVMSGLKRALDKLKKKLIELGYEQYR